MEDLNPQVATVSPVPPNQPQEKKSFPTIFFIILLILVVGSGSGFTGFQLGKESAVDTSEVVPSVTPTESPEAPAKLLTSWNTAKFGGLFTYDYPEGWHVGELWGDNYSENGIMIVIDPKPISNAPRGGPIGLFEITVLNGDSPDEILAKRIAQFNDANYTDITKETLKSDIGEIYYYKGKRAGDYMKGSPVESYFFTVKPSENDPRSNQVIVVTMAFQDDKEFSEMLRHIVLSFKKVNL